MAEVSAPSKKKIVSSRQSMLAFSDELLVDQGLPSELDMLNDLASDSSPVKVNRRRSSMVARRRSSIGGLSSMSEAEQQRITEMYRTVIQMSSENVSVLDDVL